MLTEPHYISVSNINSATRIPIGSNLTELAELSAGLRGAVEITSYRFITGYTILLSFLFLLIIMFKEIKLNLIVEKTQKIKKNKARIDAVAASEHTMPVDRHEQARWPESLNTLFHKVIDILRERKPCRHSMFNIEEMAEKLNSYAYCIEPAVKVNTGSSFEEVLLLYRMNDVLVHLELNRGYINRRTLMLKCGFTDLKKLEDVFKTHIGVDIDTYRYMIQNSDK